ncbi:MAG: hypothetical protein D6726_01515 [Nitrospirae bacterium]|nr:MAG: hypothetical protein D6726_01515 [Nitrospirota bacterium]
MCTLRRGALFPLLSSLLLIILPLGAKGGSTVNADRSITALFTVESSGHNKKYINETERLLPDVISEIRASLGWDFSKGGKIILADSEHFKKIVSFGQISAIAIPERGLIVIDLSKTASDPFRFRSTLKHELIHLLLHEHIKSTPLPRWFNEGVAQFFSDGISEILISTKGDILRKAYLSNRLITIPSLDPAFNHPDTILLAYEESKSFVEFLEDRFGKGTLRKILKGMDNGKTIYISISEATGTEFARIETEWIRSLNKRDSILSYLSNYFVTFLFVFGGLLATYGFIRMLIRKRQYRDEEEEEESTFYD